MQIFLFVIDGKPGYRPSLHEAQACLEDHLIDAQNLSEVQWGDVGDDRYGAYLWAYGGNFDEAAPHTGQIIWPITVELPVEKLDPLMPGGAELVMTVLTDNGKNQIIERVSREVWDEARIRPHIVMHFASRAGRTLGDHWIKKEST